MTKQRESLDYLFPFGDSKFVLMTQSKYRSISIECMTHNFSLVFLLVRFLSWTQIVMEYWIYTNWKTTFVTTNVRIYRKIWHTIFYECTMTIMTVIWTLRNFIEWVCAKNGYSIVCYRSIVDLLFRPHIDLNRMKLVSEILLMHLWTTICSPIGVCSSCSQCVLFSVNWKFKFNT